MKKSIDERVKSFAKPASSVEHSGNIVAVLSRADIAEINKTIEPKIRQNAKERKESYEEARDVIVKD